MKTDLNTGQVSGTLPILYVFLARSGRPSATSAWLRSTIKVSCTPRTKPRQERHARRPDRVLRAPTARSGRCIISPPIFPMTASEFRLLKFCQTLTPANSLIKSASYLMHNGNFTVVRDFLLADSATIIQDDSGIPLSQYVPAKWRFFSLWPLRWSDCRISRKVPTEICRAVSAQPADRFRNRLPLANVRIQPVVVGQGPVTAHPAAHHCTFWLGTMKLVVLGASERPVKNLQATTIKISRTNIVTRSTYLGS